MYNDNESNPSLINCTFVNNSAVEQGGGMYSSTYREVNGSHPTLTACVFRDNHATLGGGGIHSETNSDSTLVNTIICGNGPDQITGEWIDEGGNCVDGSCDDCFFPALSVIPDPLCAGEGAVFMFKFGTPNERVYLAYSLRGIGSTYVPILNVTLDLDQPIQIVNENGSWKVADEDGSARQELVIPEEASGYDLWFQACQYEVKTNVAETWVE